MNSLQEPVSPVWGTIIWNPLFSPNANLVDTVRGKKFLFMKSKKITLFKRDFHIEQFQSQLGTYSFYDPFHESVEDRIALIGQWWKDAVMRILPSDSSFEEHENFLDGSGVVEKSLNCGLVEQIRFSSAIMKIIDVVVECSSEETEGFDILITEQLEKFADSVEELWLSEREVFQITELWQWKIWLFPKDYFDTPWTPHSEKKTQIKLPNLLGWFSQGWLVTW